MLDDAVRDLRNLVRSPYGARSEAQIAIRSWTSYRYGDRLPIPGCAPVSVWTMYHLLSKGSRIGRDTCILQHEVTLASFA